MWKKLIVAIAVIAFVGIVIAVREESRLRATPANVVITKAGRYLSPNGTHVLEVWPQEGGLLKYYVSGKTGGGGPTKPFSPKSEWFMCWDSQDRLWAFVTEQDPKYCSYYYSNDKESGGCTVGEFGGWDGIPDSFLARLPDATKAIRANYLKSRESTVDSKPLRR